MQKGALVLSINWTRMDQTNLWHNTVWRGLSLFAKGVERDEEIHHISYIYSVNSLPYLSQNLNQFILLYDDHSSRQGPLFLFLNLVLLNKLGCHTHFSFSANQITWSRLLIQIQILNGKQCRSRSVGFFRSQLIWVYTVCKGMTYPCFSRTRVNQTVLILFSFSTKTYVVGRHKNCLIDVLLTNSWPYIFVDN